MGWEVNLSAVVLTKSALYEQITADWLATRRTNMLNGRDDPLPLLSVTHPQTLRAGARGVPRSAGDQPRHPQEGNCYAASLLLADPGVRKGLSPVSVRQMGVCSFPLPVSAKALMTP